MNQRNILAVIIITSIAMMGQLLIVVTLTLFGDNDWLIMSLTLISHVLGMVIFFLIYNKIHQRFSTPSFGVTLSLVFLTFGLYIVSSGFFSTSLLAWEGVAATLVATCPVSIIGYYMWTIISGYDSPLGMIMMVFIGTIYYLVLGKIIEKFTFEKQVNRETPYAPKP